MKYMFNMFVLQIKSTIEPPSVFNSSHNVHTTLFYLIFFASDFTFSDHFSINPREGRTVSEIRLTPTTFKFT